MESLAGGLSIQKLSHHDRDFHGLAGGGDGEHIAGDGRTVDGDALHALLHGVGILDPDVVHGPAVAAGDGEAGQRVWDAGVDLQVQAAVPVSQLFFASPKVGASMPATIWL